MKQTLGVGIAAGILAALLVEIGGMYGVISWVGFVAMLTYYSTPGGKDGLIKSLASNLSGVFWGWMIIFVSGKIPIPHSLGLTVVVIVILMCMQSYFSVLSFIPGTFAGASCYFGTNFDAKSVIIALIIGNILAIVSAVIGGKIGNLLEGKQQSEATTGV